MEIKEKLLCGINKHIESFIEIKGYSRFINEELKIGFGKYYGNILFWIFNSPEYYYIKYEETVIYITKKEYEEIIKIREEKIKEKQLEELEKLCNNN